MPKEILTEIAREQWVTFVNDFSRRNQGRTTKLEIFGELGAQEEEQHLPFNGLSLDISGKGAPRLAIMLGKGAQHVTHTVTNVTHLLPKQTGEGKDEAFEIESAEGEKTLLRFES